MMEGNCVGAVVCERALSFIEHLLYARQVANIVSLLPTKILGLYEFSGRKR
jgi:hypothetical protein